MHERHAHEYRSDPAMPDFDDSKPLFVFDGVCVLCSGGAAWLMRHDRQGRVNFTSAQSPLGQALYRHFGMEMDETYLLIDRGRAFSMSGGYFRLFAILGGWWTLLRPLSLIPRPIRDWVYGLIAANRYRWFGKVETCALLSEDQRRRLL